MFISTFRIIKFAGQNFWRNFWLSLITISMLVITLLTVNILLAMNRVADLAIHSVENKIEVSVYFNENAPISKINDAMTFLRSLLQVKDVVMLSADESLSNFKKLHANNPAIINSLSEIGTNPFGSMLKVKLNEAKDFQYVISALNNPRFSDAIREKDYSDYGSVVSKIQDITNKVRFGGIVLTGIFFLIALLIVFNTVRFSIFIHREEIAIMRLVGASNGFIRAPFLLEMILIALISVLITIAIVYPTFLFLEPHITNLFGTDSVGLVSYFEQNGFIIFGLQLLVLIVVTMCSAGVAMRKYLKV